MILVDANVLLYAYHPRAAQHERCRAWVEAEFSSGAAVGIPWATIVAFLRIGTSPRVFERPLTIAEAEAAVSSWLALPSVSPIDPGERYWDVLRDLLHAAQVTGPLVSDARIFERRLIVAVPPWVDGRVSPRSARHARSVAEAAHASPRRSPHASHQTLRSVPPARQRRKTM